MMTGNLSIEQRKWILKEYWKTENAERVRTAWVEAFNTPPPIRLTIASETSLMQRVQWLMHQNLDVLGRNQRVHNRRIYGH
jgi:hypothetical protein